MKTLSFSLLMLAISLFIGATRPLHDQFSLSGTDANAPGFAVVELFTSEGCSSCPSADALVAKIQKENEDKPVYILAFHVDYWNRLGWKDVFSDPAFTKRQRQYASWLRLSTVYTPQAIINGNKEFLGSQETAMRKAIKEGLDKKVLATIDFGNVKTSGGQIGIDYKITGPIANSSFILALVQKKAESRVRSGENAGKILSHVQITRSIQMINLNGKPMGTGKIVLPKGVNRADVEVIALLQNNQSGEIIAASKAVLENLRSNARL